MALLRWGCVADDFTGASDLASFLVNKGVNTLLICGEPQKDHILQEGVQAIVIALKSRTAPTDDAVNQTMLIFEWLQKQGCEKLYFKYCSTFDSTENGNIGPVIDALLERLNIPYTILNPALLVNGRTVKNGKLYVNGVLLEDSGMRNHPLTPMRHSDIKVLIERQGKYKCLVITHEDYQKGIHHIQEKIRSFSQSHSRFYISVDFFTPEHGNIIMECFKELPLLTGASGLMEHMADTYWELHASNLLDNPKNSNHCLTGARFILVGSCSEMTGKQIQRYIDSGGASIKISPHSLVEKVQTLDTIWDDVAAIKDGDVLIYSSGAIDGVERRDSQDGEAAASLLENLMGSLAAKAIHAGYQKIVVAGGETSGAVVNQLGYREFHVAESVDPGVPVLIPIHANNLRIVLKSGNFGSENFFIKALN